MFENPFFFLLSFSFLGKCFLVKKAISYNSINHSEGKKGIVKGKQGNE